METRLKTIDRTLSEKAHLAEERIKSRTAMWGMAITVALIVIEVILYLSGKR
jgi:predicted nucleic acid-binding Zn ribbon protein